MQAPEVHRSWLRGAAVAAAIAVLAGATVFTAWQLVLARVPQHRATLERLVRNHTGLDVRFNELGLRWGWYGPEAVFREVELGEPGRSGTLLRAPELTVGFDAWRTMQSGQLRAGRITLIAPEIDLTRPGSAGPRGGRSRTQNEFARLLRGWQGGRVDVESAAVRLRLGTGTVILRVPHGTLRRSRDEWSASAQLLLPERLGRNARISLQLEGDPARIETLSGRARVAGTRLTFASWRELLGSYMRNVRAIPAAGTGNVELRFAFRGGDLHELKGEIAADEVRITPLAMPVELGYLKGEWRLARREQGWRLDVHRLRAGPNGRTATPAALTLDLNPAARQAEARLDIVPVDLLALAVGAAVPRVPLDGLQLSGLAHGVRIAWDGTRAPGSRLDAAARVTDLSLGAPARGVTLRRASARLRATDISMEADLEASDGELALDGEPARRFTDLRLATHVVGRLDEDGWEVTTDRLVAEHADGRVALSARFAAASGDTEPRLTLRANLADASLPVLRDLLLPGTLPALVEGRIESGELDLAAPLGVAPWNTRTERFKGSLAVRDASVEGDEQWPSVEGIEASVRWEGPRLEADVTRAHAAGAQIAAARAEWSMTRRVLQVSGQAFGRLEQGIEWLRARPALQDAVHGVQQLDAAGDALLEFSATVREGEIAPSRLRFALTLDGARVHPGGTLPPVEALRGALVLEDGRLRRTTLVGRWFGGPMSMRLAELSGAASPAVELRAEGLFDAALLASAAALPAEQLQGNASWIGRLVVSGRGEAARFAGFAESTLLGVASELPAPLAKPATEPMPLHIEVESASPALPVELRVSAGKRIDGRFALTSSSVRGWRIERGAMRFGGGAEARLPDEAVLAFEGRVARLDLARWLAVHRLAPRADAVPAIRADVSADELELAGRRFEGVRLAAREDAGITTLTAESEALAGSVRVPSKVSARRPIEIDLVRLDLPAAHDAVATRALVASLAPAARLRAAHVRWDGRTIGQVHARLLAERDGVRIDSFRAVGDAHELRGWAQCDTPIDACRLEVHAASGDAVGALRDLGFADELDAREARLSAELEWRREPARPWLASLTGTLAFALEDGRVRAASAAAQRSPFALFTMPALLREEGASETPAPDAPGAFPFRRLEADYELRDGQAYTTNLHFDGETEILARGRIGLVDRDYDQVAWVLEGEERLPAAVRRFGATPNMAAAWLRLRDWLGGPDIEDSRAVLHLYGSWARPIVGAPVAQGEAK